MDEYSNTFSVDDIGPTSPTNRGWHIEDLLGSCPNKPTIPRMEGASTDKTIYKHHAYI